MSPSSIMHSSFGHGSSPSMLLPSSSSSNDIDAMYELLASSYALHLPRTFSPRLSHASRIRAPSLPADAIPASAPDASMPTRMRSSSPFRIMVLATSNGSPTRADPWFIIPTDTRSTRCMAYSRMGRLRCLTQYMQSTGHDSMAIVMSSSESAHCWNARALPHSSSIMNVLGAEWLHCRQPMHAASLTKTARAFEPLSVGSCPTNLDMG
mmetsp:Transcript_5506/g.24464  ORF Transcript_5506/g.24464 Transcript_5506/m.24464 type:complete len:209 (+) Transcript_5506:1317-1943(+)